MRHGGTASLFNRPSSPRPLTFFTVASPPFFTLSPPFFTDIATRIPAGPMDDTKPDSSMYAPPPSVQQAAEASSPSSPPGAAAGADAETRRAGEDDDEQVERFYALLANIRAMRGAFSTTATGKRKRLARGRSEEPPWRPAFKMEDFETEEVGSGACVDAGGRKHKRGCASPRMPAGSETGAVAADNDDGDEGADVVLERNGPRRAAVRG